MHAPEDFSVIFIRHDLSAMMIAALLPAKQTDTVAWVQADEHALVHYIQGMLHTGQSAQPRSLNMTLCCPAPGNHTNISLPL